MNREFPEYWVETTQPSWSGKTRNPERIAATLDLIRDVWVKSPDMRLGQLLVAFAHIDFGVEDDVVFERLLDTLEKDNKST